MQKHSYHLYQDYHNGPEKKHYLLTILDEKFTTFDEIILKYMKISQEIA